MNHNLSELLITKCSILFEFNKETGQSYEILHDENKNMTLLGNLSEAMTLKRNFVTIYR